MEQATIIAAMLGAIAVILSSWKTYELTKSHYEQKRRKKKSKQKGYLQQLK